MHSRACPSRHWVLPILLVVLALALRLAVFALGPARDLSRALAPDSPRYLELGQHLTRTGTFALQEDDAGPMHGPAAALRAQRGELEARNRYGLRPEIMRTPGYPAFLAGAAFLGATPLGVLVIQCLLSSAAVLGVYALGLVLLDSRPAAAVAALILALHPADILAANTLLTESLFTAMLLAGTLLALRRPASTPAAAGSGLLIGLATLVRPVSLLLGPVLGLWLYLHDRRARTAAAALLLTLASLLPPALWATRNASQGAGWRLSSLDSIQNFTKTVAYMRMTAAGQQEYPRDWLKTLPPLYAELSRAIRPGETVLHAMDRLTLNEIKTHPLLYLRVLAGSSVKLMTDHSAPAWAQLLGLRYQPTGLRDALLGAPRQPAAPVSLACAAVAGALFLFNLALALAMLAGLVRLVRLRHYALALGLASVIGYFLLTTQAVGVERMRVPILAIQALAVAALLIRRSAPVAATSAAPIAPASPAPTRALTPKPKATSMPSVSRPTQCHTARLST
jgi:hypothetical protein